MEKAMSISKEILIMGISTIMGFTAYWFMPYGVIKGMIIENIREKRAKNYDCFYDLKQELKVLFITLFLGPLLMLCIIFSGYSGEGWTLRAPKDLLRKKE